MILVCGQVGSECGDDADFLTPYLDWANGQGYSVKWKSALGETEGTDYKKDIADQIAGMIADNPNANFILIGHSAGADAIISSLAKLSENGDYPSNIVGVGLLDPSMEGSGGVDLHDALKEAAANIPLFVAESTNNAVDESKAGLTSDQHLGPLNIDHNGMSNDTGVFDTMLTKLGLR